MPLEIRPAVEDDIDTILVMVARFVAQNIMLPRTEEEIRRALGDWLVAVDTVEDTATDAANGNGAQPSGGRVVGFGSLVPLTPTLVEVRSLAVDESRQGTGLGSQLVLELVQMARTRGYEQACALTLRPAFFERLGFAIVDRWSISPKVWQACIYCPKFHRCDEVAVLMNLAAASAAEETALMRTAGWNKLLKYGAWQPLKLAYQQKPGDPKT